MGIFSRIFNIGKAEAHNALDKLEDPIKMTEQGIRDLKTDLNQSLQGLAEIKALAIRAKNDNAKFSNDAKQYEQKAVMLLQKAQAGQISPQEADRLAGEMLKMKESAEADAQRTAKEMMQHETSVSTMEQNINKLKSKITTYDNELRTLKARAKVSDATKKINKQLAQVDSSSTISMLERMKDKVAQDEALAESYGAIALENKSVAEEVDTLLGSGSSSDALLALKSKMGLLGTTTDTPPPPAS
ncbi:MAG: PspA/IM30 family protein [Cytophagales bacterium]|nr:MAG: PspA/IM30 family protein [Cytophagales bacterium]